MTYELTPDDIKNGVTLIPSDETDDGTIVKPFGTFRGGECVVPTVAPADFRVPSSAFVHGDELRENRLYKCADTGFYVERSVWVSGYTAEEYSSLAEKLNENATGGAISAFNGVVRFYADTEEAVVRHRNEERIAELKATLARDYDYKQFKWLRGELTAAEWEVVKAEIDGIVAEINRLEAEIAEA